MDSGHRRFKLLKLDSVVSWKFPPENFLTEIFFVLQLFGTSTTPDAAFDFWTLRLSTSPCGWSAPPCRSSSVAWSEPTCIWPHPALRASRLTTMTWRFSFFSWRERKDGGCTSRGLSKKNFRDFRVPISHRSVLFILHPSKSKLFYQKMQL